MNVMTEDAACYDLAGGSVRELNSRLHQSNGIERYQVLNPAGSHNIAVGISADTEIQIEGHCGYYCAGMNDGASIRIRGNCGVGVAENMMSGRVDVMGSAGQSAAASAHGGLTVIHGDAAARCAISLKGADVVVAGSIGHASAFMAQSGRLLVLGDAGPGLGDSLYEARIFVRGSVASLGADCIEKELRPDHVEEIENLLAIAGIDGVVPAEFRRFGSARHLYEFKPGGPGV